MRRLAVLCSLVGSATAALVVGACTAPTAEDARRAWLVDQLAEQNLELHARDPAMVAGKLIRMQGHPHAWMRGTADVFWRDLAGPGPWAIPTAFADAASDRVLILGDPHLENLGSFCTPDHTLVFDWNDFDAAGYGPYWGDLRRLAVAVVIAAYDRIAGDDVAADRLATAVARGYADEIAAIADGGDPPAFGAGGDPFVDELLAKAGENGDAGARLADYTRIDGDGARYMVIGDVAPVARDGTWTDRMIEVGAARPTIELAIARWRATAIVDAPPAAFAIKGMTRRLGAGVASYPALRYYVLLEGPTPAIEDDWLVELKETRDGPALLGPPRYGPGFTTAAERVVRTQRASAARPDEDDLLGWADVPPLSFRVRHRTAYQRGMDVLDLLHDLDDGDAGLDQLAALARVAGRLLARAHARTATLDGAPAIDAIAPQLAGRTDELAAETAGFAVGYAAQTIADWITFVDDDLATEVYP